MLGRTKINQTGRIIKPYSIPDDVRRTYASETRLTGPVIATALSRYWLLQFYNNVVRKHTVTAIQTTIYSKNSAAASATALRAGGSQNSRARACSSHTRTYLHATTTNPTCPVAGDTRAVFSLVFYIRSLPVCRRCWHPFCWQPLCTSGRPRQWRNSWSWRCSSAGRTVWRTRCACCRTSNDVVRTVSGAIRSRQTGPRSTETIKRQ